MPLNEKRLSPDTLLLIVEEGDPDGDKAIALLRRLKGFQLRVRYLKEKDEETVTPWLNSVAGNFYGLRSIEQGFVDWELERAKEREAS